MNGRVLIIALLFSAILAVSSASKRINFQFNNNVINGVAPEVRIHWMRYAFQNNSLGSSCPKNPYGAIVVNRTSNTIVAAKTPGGQSARDPTQHGEMNVIQNVAKLFPFNGFNSGFWQELSLYTTGEPCPMCMTASRYARFGEVIFSSSITFLEQTHWDQVRGHTHADDINTLTDHWGDSTILIGGVLEDELAPQFAWQNNPDADYPIGCQRNAQGSCADL